MEPGSAPLIDDVPKVETHLRTGHDRRRAARRATGRNVSERRRGDRRRAGALAGLVAGALGLMAHGRLTIDLSNPIAPRVEIVSAAPAPAPDVDAEPTTRYERFIKEAADLYDVSADLVRAVIQTESNFDARAQSGAGARGLMQLTPITLREVKMAIDPFDPRENIMAGTKYLGMMLDRHDGNVPLALASYNAGPTAVRRHRGIPPYKETRGYVKKVQKAMADASQEVAPSLTSRTLAD